MLFCFHICIWIISSIPKCFGNENIICEGREKQCKIVHILFLKKKTRKRSLWHLSLSSIKPNAKKNITTERERKRGRNKRTLIFSSEAIFIPRYTLMYIQTWNVFIPLCTIRKMRTPPEQKKVSVKTDWFNYVRFICVVIVAINSSWW